jgi:hypothetical protein
MMISEKPNRGLTTGSATEAENASIAEYGITRVSADRFDVAGFRYTHVADAVAQARRRRDARR